MKCPGCGKEHTASEVVVVSETVSKWPCIKCGKTFTIVDFPVSCEHCGEKMKLRCEAEREYIQEITCLKCNRTFFVQLPGPLLEGPFR